MPVILSEAKDQAHPPPDVYDLPSDGDAQPDRNQLYKHLRGW